MSTKEQQERRLAVAFHSVLQEWLDEDELKQVDTRNKEYAENICATHDFCDANMAMHEAFIRVIGHEPDPDDDEDEDLWDVAWGIAKKHGFSKPWT